MIPSFGGGGNYISNFGFWFVVLTSLIGGVLIMAAMKHCMEEGPQLTDAEKRAYQRQYEARVFSE